MTKKLLVVAGSGLILAILLLSAAWVAGGQAMMAAARHGGWNFDFSDDDHDHGAKVTRSLIFDPDAPVTIDAPVHFHFVRGDHVAMTVTGSAPLVDKLRWNNNRLTMADATVFGNHALRVEVVAPRLPPLTFNGAGDVDLEKLRQQDLRIQLSGAGNIDANGTVHMVTAASSGAGNIDLGELNTTGAAVSVAGVGNIDVNASGQVDASIAGAGNVSLHRKPARLTSQINGIGSVNQDY